MLICGLGNIGDKYANTRHNAGFIVVDKLAEKLNLKIDKKACKSTIARRMKDELIIQKPETYMNLSGIAVKEAMGQYHFEKDEIIIVYDDIDLPLGTIRYREKGSAGTHNGMRSIISEIGTTEFARLRIGIGKPPVPQMDLADYVLGKFSSEELAILNKSAEDAIDVLLSKIK
ncbi:MAG: aminoacyl-tRNA hydrolase [Bacillota bacterium]